MVSTVIARVQGPQRRKAANMCSAACAIAATARGVRALDRSAGLPDEGFPDVMRHPAGAHDCGRWISLVQS